MKGQYRKDRPHEFTIAYWRTVEDCEKTCKVSIRLTALNSTYPGFVAFDLAARDIYRGPEDMPVARVTDLWPNAHEQPFEVFLYQMAFKLAAMVENWYRERAEEGKARR